MVGPQTLFCTILIHDPTCWCLVITLVQLTVYRQHCLYTQQLSIPIVLIRLHVLHFIVSCLVTPCLHFHYQCCLSWNFSLAVPPPSYLSFLFLRYSKKYMWCIFLYLAVDHTQIKIIYTLLEIKKNMYVACRMRRVDMLSVMGNWHVEIQPAMTAW